MRYPVRIYQIETEGDPEWVAECDGIQGCVGGGDTIEEAYRELEENLEFHLECLEMLEKKEL